MPADAMTLYVLHTDRAPEVATDGVAAARWASQHTCTVALVVGPGKAPEYRECGADLLYESAAPGNGLLADFRFLDGLRQALNEGVGFEQAICFRDDATFLGKKVDDVFSRAFYSESADLIAPADRRFYGDHFMRVGDMFSQWRLPHEAWDRPPATFTAHTAAFALTHKLASEMFYRNLLLPPAYELWRLPVGAFVTWVCQLLVLPFVARGSMDRPIAPFYVNDGWGGQYNPPPYLLHQNVLIYWSLRRVCGYTEAETRQWCKTLRQTNP